MAKLSASYELMVVLSLTKGEEAAQATWAKFKELIEANGTLGEVDEWGKRKLAYPINYMNEGYYVHMEFEAPHEFPAELDRNYNITESVIRGIIVNRDEK